MDRPVASAAQRILTFRVITHQTDIPTLITLAKEAHEESRFSHIPFNASKVCKIAQAALKSNKQHGVFLAEKRGIPVGFAYCTVGEYHIGHTYLVATIHNINVSHSVRRALAGGRVALGLFNGVHSWAFARGANEIFLHVTSGINLAASHRVAKRLGYTLVGGSYAKNLRNS